MMVIPALNPANTQTILGTYYLSGVMDTTSGIKLNADRTFNFFYSYGAIDRNGTGTYHLKNNCIILNSLQQGEKDFNLVKSNRDSFNGMTIKIIDTNPLLAKYVSCCIATKAGLQRAQTNDEGITQFRNQQADSIILIHLLFPGRTSIFQLNDQQNNYFEFAIEPSIVNVHFNNFELKLNNNELTGGHPLIGGVQYPYLKK